MTYWSYLAKAKDLVIQYDENNDYYYLDPSWVEMLHESGLEYTPLENSPIMDVWDFEDALKLEVERRNGPKKAFVINWLYDLLTNVADPTIVSEENELIKNLMAYMEMKNKTEEQNNPVFSDMDFSKK